MKESGERSDSLGTAVPSPALGQLGTAALPQLGAAAAALSPQSTPWQQTRYTADLEEHCRAAAFADPESMRQAGFKATTDLDGVGALELAKGAPPPHSVRAREREPRSGLLGVTVLTVLRRMQMLSFRARRRWGC